MPIFLEWEGAMLPVEKMLDVDGEETQDPTLAVAVVARHPEGWIAELIKDVRLVSEQELKSKLT
jgi:hypothetical protein